MLVTVEIVILAMIAAFLGLRLYAVLGRRAEHGDEQAQHETAASRFDASATQTAQSNPPRVKDRGADRAPLGAARVREPLSVLPTVERGLREIIAVDRRFDPHAFLEGARGAYGIVLSAFGAGTRTNWPSCAIPRFRPVLRRPLMIVWPPAKWSTTA
jgi:predicted lipid-binding transport protein (Tim44 family)